MLAAQARKLPRGKRALVATIVIETISGMLFLAAREPDMSTKVVEEAKLLLRRYIEAYTG